MRRIALIALLALAVGAQAATPGRTDGPEGSEYGKGGYHHKAQYGRFYTEGFLGAAMMESEVSDTETDLITGLNVGYMVEEWLAFQLGFARILDQNINLYAGGVRSAYVNRPFNYYFSLDAELYSPEIGDTRFGIVPGVGAEVILSDRVRAGLRFQRDFIFADEMIHINRFTAKIQVDF
jgi:hypothetical protein